MKRFLNRILPASCSVIRRSLCASARLVEKNGKHDRRQGKLVKRGRGEIKHAIEEEIVPPALRDVETASEFLKYAMFRMQNLSKVQNSAQGSKEEGDELSKAIDKFAIVLGVDPEEAAAERRRHRRDKNDLREYHKHAIEARSGKSKSLSSSSSSRSEKEITLSFGQMTADAEEDMRFLICEFLNIPCLEWNTATRRAMENRLLTPREILAMDSLLDKRIRKQIPVAYLLQRAYFQGMKLYVNENVIIPRSFLGEILVGIEERHKEALGGQIRNDDITSIQYPTEFATIDNLFNPGSIRRVLDLCCGSGALGLLSTRIFKDNLEYVDLTDISELACKVAEKNCIDLGFQDITNVYCGDLFGGVAKKAKPVEFKYDLIVCKPPYEIKATLSSLPREYKKEPIIAFDGGKEGVDIIMRVLKESVKFLSLPIDSTESVNSRNKSREIVNYEDRNESCDFLDVRYEYDVKRDGGILMLEIGDNLETLVKKYPLFQQYVMFLDTATSKLEVITISRNDLESLLGKAVSKVPEKKAAKDTKNDTSKIDKELYKKFAEIDFNNCINDDDDDEIDDHDEIDEDDYTDDEDDDEDEIDPEELQRIIDMVNQDPQNILRGESVNYVPPASEKRKGWTRKKC